MFDVTADLVAWVPGALGVPAFADPPAQRPAEFVTVERTGGPREVGIDRPSVALQAWAGSSARASTLASELARGLLESYPARARVWRCDVSGIYEFADPDSGHARWQVTADLVVQP